MSSPSERPLDNAIRTEAGDAIHPAGDGSQQLPTPALVPQLLPPPRTVRRRRGSLLGHVSVLVWLLCLVGLGLVLLDGWWLGSALAVSLFGTTVQGKVAAKFPSKSGPGAISRVKVMYQIGDQEYSADDTVAEGDFLRLYVGSPVKVRVLPSWPERARLQEPPGQSGDYVSCLSFVAVLWNFALGIVLWRSVRNPRGQRSLIRDGVATAGWIVRKEVDVSKRSCWVVHYGYRAPRHGLAPDTAALTDEVPAREWLVIMQVGQKDFETVQVGTAVTVLYDPAKPSRSVIYPFAEYEAVAT